MKENRSERQAQGQKMQEIMENATYEEWQESHGDCPLFQDINSDNFDKFKEAWQLKRDGEYEKSQELMAELGLENGFNMKRNNLRKNISGKLKMNCDCPRQK